MLLKSLLLITSLSIGPHSLDQWLRHWDLLPMPPINRNLTATSLDGKTLIIHDSQGIPSFIRAWQYMPLRAGTAGKTLSGYQVNARVFETLGYKNTSTASSGTTFTLLNIGDNWPVEADHDGVHWTNSQGVTFGTELANFTEFFSMAVKSSAFDSFDMSSPMIMRLGIFNTTNHTERLNLLEFRGATTGFAANYGNGGSGSFRGGDQDWDETDQLYIIHKGFKSAAATREARRGRGP